MVHRGELVKTARVKDVVRREDNLTKTTSHNAWGTFLETDRSGASAWGQPTAVSSSST